MVGRCRCQVGLEGLPILRLALVRGHPFSCWGRLQLLLLLGGNDRPLHGSMDMGEEDTDFPCVCDLQVAMHTKLRPAMKLPESRHPVNVANDNRLRA